MTAKHRGPQPEHSNDVLFATWYNDGERRTLQKVAELHDVAYNTVRKYADLHDWQGRADSIDDEAARQLNKRLARIVAKHRMAELEAMRAVTAKFIRRLTPTIKDESGRDVPNPDYLENSEISLRDAIEAGKFFELLTGGATERYAEAERGSFDPAEIDQEIIDMEARAIEREQLALPRGEGA